MQKNNEMKSLLLLLLVAVAAQLVVGARQGGNLTVKVIHMSDFHYDPLFGTAGAVGPCTSNSTRKSGLPGCDSSVEMLHGGLEAVARTIVDLDIDVAAIIYTGDWFRHDMDKNAAIANETALAFQIIDTMTAAMSANLSAHLARHERRRAAAAPGRPVKKRVVEFVHAPHVPGAMSVSLGNEDHLKDYHFDFKKPSTVVQKFASSLRSTGFLDDKQARMVGKCAFYSHVVAGFASPRLRVVVLNTLLWANKLKPALKASDTDPCGMLSFLGAELAKARRNGERVYVASHIPPVFTQWRSDFFTKYVALMTQYNDVVSAQFYGHTHRFQFCALTSKGAGISPAFVGGPFTRVSHTTSDFGVYDVDSQYRVADIHQVTLVAGATDPRAPSSWAMGPSFKAAMNVADLSAPSLYQLAYNMRHNSAYDGIFQKYFAFDQGGRVVNGTTCDTLCKHVNTCMLIAFDPVSAALCMI